MECDQPGQPVGADYSVSGFGLTAGATTSLVSDACRCACGRDHGAGVPGDGASLFEQERVRVDRARLRGEVVLVDQAAESVTAADPIDLDHFDGSSVVRGRHLHERRSLIERSVRPVFVVVERVARQHGFELATAEDQQPIEAFATESPDPALCVRSSFWRSHRRLDHTDAFGSEDFVEVTAELAVAVADQKPRLDVVVLELHDQVPRLLG